MCGINGTVGKGSTGIVDRMNRETAHRGPDATGLWNSDGVTLGHNRLAIIDLSESAVQPMLSTDGRYVIVYNGEIYNYRELKKEIGDRYHFKTQSDTEVLLAGYSVWGEEILNKLRGIFAFAIWDTDERSLLLVRDHMGVKPLYYAEQDETLFFSSELSGIITGTGLRTLSRDNVLRYIVLNYVPSPGTLIEGVHKLRPAHLLRYKNGKTTISRYWKPVTPSRNSIDKQELYSTIDGAVKGQLVSDRPLGIFLSGGFDSSIVLHHAKQHTDLPQETFSISYEMVKGAEHEREKFNADAHLAAHTAKHYGTNHHDFTISIDVVRNECHTILSSVDEPAADPTIVAQYLLSKWVRESGVVVALGGDGGDELFGGYTRHRIALGAYYLQKLPRLLLNGASHFSDTLRKLSVPFGERMHLQFLALKAPKFQSLLKSAYDERLVHDLLGGRYHEIRDDNVNAIDAFMRVDRETWLADESLHRSDRTSMAHGLEVRVPFLDLEIVNMADSMISTHKFLPWNNKKIIKDTYREHLPAHLYDQPKRGWLSPGSKWFRDEVLKKQFSSILSSEYYDGLNGLIDWQQVALMFDDHTEHMGYHIYPLWNILALQIWSKKHGTHF